MAKTTVTKSAPRGNTEATLREPRPADAQACGRIIYEAFKGIAESHVFPLDFPSAEAGIGLAQMFIGHPQIFGVVAEQDGQVIGSNFLDERSSIRAVGPITVDPARQQKGLGRRLMGAVIARGKDAEGIRLVQDAFNLASYSLYTSLGFEVKEPLVLMQGRPKSKPHKDYTVRPMESGDLKACAALGEELYGCDRSGELPDVMKMAKPFVALKGGEVRAYAAAVTFWPFNHAVAQTQEDLQALLLGAAAQVQDPLTFLLPTRRTALFQWALREGLRGVKPMTLMSMGAYHDPRGVCHPSVLF